MFDIKQVIKEAEDEVRDDQMAAAKKQIISIPDRLAA